MADNSEHTNGSRNEEEVGGECLADSGTASEARGLPSTKKLNRIDSLHLEAERVQHAQNHGAKVNLISPLLAPHMHEHVPLSCISKISKKINMYIYTCFIDTIAENMQRTSM